MEKRVFCIVDDDHPDYFTYPHVCRPEREINPKIWNLKIGEELESEFGPSKRWTRLS